MIDIHSHILYGVDDGAKDYEESVKMLKEARKAGITTIIATPHVRRPHFDKNKARESLNKLQPVAESLGIKLVQGYEYNISALADDTIEGALEFCTDGTKTILLEMNGSQLVSNWERIVIHFQREGANIIIAHPERYPILFSKPEIVSRMLEVGCKFQVDIAVMLEKGLFNREKNFVKKLLKNGMIRWVASDAHNAEDYKLFAEAFRKYADESMCTADRNSYAELIG